MAEKIKKSLKENLEKIPERDSEEVERLKNDVSHMKKEMKEASKTLTNVKHDKIRDEINMAKFSVMIRGMEIHQDAQDFETKAQTAEIIKWFLEALDLEEWVTVYRVQRFTAPKGDNRPPLIKLEMQKQEHVQMIYESFLKRVRERHADVRAISLSDCIPKCLKKEQKLLEDRSYQLRQISRSFRPKLIFHDIELALRVQTKEKNHPIYFKFAELEKLDKFIVDQNPGQSKSQNQQIPEDTEKTKNQADEKSAKTAKSAHKTPETEDQGE